MANLVKITADGTSVTGTAQTITTSSLIAANSVLVGDILELMTSVKKVVTAATLSIRIYINTANNLTGATQLGIYTGVAGTSFVYIMGRNYVVKSVTSTIGYTLTTGSITPDAASSSAYGDYNIDWTVDQYIIIALNHSSGASNNSYSTSLLVLKR
jgi:hypothetical protein